MASPVTSKSTVFCVPMNSSNEIIRSAQLCQGLFADYMLRR